MRRKGEPIDGVLLLDKPVGLSSNAALQRARRALQAERAGHTGTLDPLASGLLPSAFGEATKFAADLLDADKAYEATVALGATTSTGDAEGEVTARRPVEVDAAAAAAALARFRGAIAQRPPMHSALKHEGRALYHYARAGVEVERAERQVVIHRLELLAFDPVAAQLRLAVECSKGTYVRVLAADLGEALGCGAHLAALRRTRVGALALCDAVALDAFEALAPAQRRQLLLPADALIRSLARVDLEAEAARRLLMGQRVAGGATAAPGARVRVYGPAERLLGVATIQAGGGLAPLRLVTNRGEA